MLGLPAGKPFAFFCGSVGVLSEPGREVALVRRWITALRASADPRLRDLAVLIRPSVRAPRWRTLEFSGADNVVMCPRAYERSGELDAVLLSESVRYAAVTVGIDALALTMAASLGKPAVAVYRVDMPEAAAEAMPLEFLWTAKGSPVEFATTLEDLNSKVRAALDRPAVDPLAAPSPRFADSPSVRTANAVEAVSARSGRRARSRVPWSARVWRPPLLVIAGLVGLVERLSSARTRQVVSQSRVPSGQG